MRREKNPALQRLAEQILEDESLRRGLSDLGFQPLLDWAMSKLQYVNASTANSDAMSHGLRAILRAANRSAKTGDPGPIRSLIIPPVFSQRETKLIAERLSRLQLSTNPDENAVRIAKVLSVTE